MSIKMATIVGITGGIGSGKSVVSRLLRLLGYPVFDSDAEAKRLMDSNCHVRNKLMERFGDELYQSGTLNRKELAKLIFSSEEHRLFVNALVHPEVAESFAEWVGKQSGTIVFIESAILFESGFDRFTSKSLLVLSPVQQRVNRIIKRDGCSEVQALSKIQSQWPDLEKQKLVDSVILNDDEHSLILQVENFLNAFSCKKIGC